MEGEGLMGAEKSRQTEVKKKIPGFHATECKNFFFFFRYLAHC